MAAPKHASGVLPATNLKKDHDASSPNAPRGSSRRSAGPRTKVIIRRLPPGLTEAEFHGTLGDDWKIGAGKVDWFDFQPGNISKDASKPSRPARAYLHVTDQAHLKTLADCVQQCNFIDGKNTARDPALIGRPNLEFAPYTRIPSKKARPDARQGTIDQDPEFIAFLQSLTEPVSKPSAVDLDAANAREKILTTPLIEHLREKKAAKDKAKAGKGKQEIKEAKIEKVTKKGKAVDTPEKTKKTSRAEKEKAAKEAVKVLSKQATATTEQAPPPASSKTAPERKPERAPRIVSAQARILQDLGQGPGRRAKREANGAPAPVSSEAASSKPAAAPSAVMPNKKESRGARQSKASKPIEKTAEAARADSPKPIPTGPAQPTILKKTPLKGPVAASRQANPPKGPRAQTPVSPAPVTVAPSEPASLPRHAFLKHANPSQGITEPLIEEALQVFGAIERVEIDRKKGFAYVDFADHEGMKKAIAGSPIKVAQGAVQVLEKRDKGVQRPAPLVAVAGRAGFRSGRGGARGGKGPARGAASPAKGDAVAAASGAPAATPTPAPEPT